MGVVLAMLVVTGAACLVVLSFAALLRHIHAEVLPGHRDQCDCRGCNLHRMDERPTSGRITQPHRKGGFSRDMHETTTCPMGRFYQPEAPARQALRWT